MPINQLIHLRGSAVPPEPLQYSVHYVQYVHNYLKNHIALCLPVSVSGIHDHPCLLAAVVSSWVVPSCCCWWRRGAGRLLCWLCLLRFRVHQVLPVPAPASRSFPPAAALNRNIFLVR